MRCCMPLGHRVLATLKICEECIKREPKASTQCACGAMLCVRGVHVSLLVNQKFEKPFKKYFY